jgi:methylthioribose-1-phosphate isomerase
VVFEGWELAKGLGVGDPERVVLPVLRNWADVPRIAGEVADHLAAADDRTPPAFLIARHGLTAWGRDLGEALNRLECVEALSRLVVLTGEHGDVEGTGRSA